ncbi:TPA: group II intron maturase-specific domain-containing protein [Bacillus cereus]
MVEVKRLQDKKFGYVRVSSKDQNEERQIENMKYLGIEDRDIFIDKQSGENYEMLKRLARTGDTIVFDSLTRLGRSMNDVLEEFRYSNGFIVQKVLVKKEAESMYDKLKPYLDKRGLKLAPDKTKVVHTNEGFDFLGFNSRHYATSKEKGRIWKLIVKPSKKSQTKMKEKIKECFKTHQGSNVQALIVDVNPIIRGYANYWKTTPSKELFSKMDNSMWKKRNDF